MAMLRGSTYVCAVKFWGCDGVEVDGTRVVKAEFAVGGLKFLYEAGGENERVVYDEVNNRFLLVLGEEDTLGFAGKSVRWQAKAMMVDGSVSGTLVKNEYLYDTLCTTVLNTEGVEVDVNSQGRILEAMLESVLGGGGQGTTDYEDLENKPSINNVTLEGNKTSAELGLASADDVPTKTSDLTNDGDGESPFATESYVETNGGKIDSISVNGVEQTIDENKNVNLIISDEDTGATSVDFTGSGNAVTDASYSAANRKITFTKGATYTTASDVGTLVSGKQDAANNANLTTTDKTIVGAINEVNSLAKGRVYTKEYDTISDMVTALNAMSATELKAGDNVYIVATGVPDLWVGKVESSATTYTYTTDNDFVNAITGSLSTTVQVGYYRLCELETEKVDLSNVVDSNSTISSSGSGNAVTGMSIDSNGNVTLTKGITAVETTRTIAGVDLQDNITKSEMLTALNVEDGAEVNDIASISAGGTTLTPDANKNVNVPIADIDNFGVVKINTAQLNYNGIGIVDGKLYVQKAGDGDISSRTNNYKPIVAPQINTIVKAALTDANKVSLTDAEKTSALDTLGIRIGIGGMDE